MQNYHRNNGKQVLYNKATMIIFSSQKLGHSLKRNFFYDFSVVIYMSSLWGI